MSGGVVASGLIWTGLTLAAVVLWHRRREQRAAQHRAAPVVLSDVAGVRQALAATDETVALDVPAFVTPSPALAGLFRWPSPSVVAWVCPRRHPDGLEDGPLLRFICDGRGTVEHIVWVDPRKDGWEAQLVAARNSHQYMCSTPRPRISPEANGVHR